MDMDEAPEEEVEEGAPAWLATFADLMSLLMCFFVLLLTFSEMDAQKYKQVAGSMREAFGIQRAIEADVIPKGTTVITQEFSPGKPEPTVIPQIRQVTTDETRPVPEMDTSTIDVDDLLERVREALREEIEAETLEVVRDGEGVKIRIRERDSFPSGSAVLQDGFEAVLDKLLDAVLNVILGEIIVEGHTDDVPIATLTYPSNWVLSAARSASVVHYLTRAGLEDPSRIEIRAHADSIPVVPNDTPTDRARNRRVEINIRLPKTEE